MKRNMPLLKRVVFVVSLAIIVSINITCKKDYDSPLGNNKVEFASITTDSISYFSAKVHSQLNKTGGYTISDFGLCWNIEPNPDISKSHKSFGSTSSAIDISTGITNLLSGKKYYIRPYATIPSGTVYGPQSEFHTLKTGLPVTTTDTVTLITTSTADCQGIVVADSGLMVTKRGICWSLSPLPTFTSNSDTSGKGLGSFGISLHNLNSSSKYYFRAFAVNDSGTSYGAQKTFTTKSLSAPVLSTSQITNITQTSAQSGGKITSDGDSPVTARGICWGTTQAPSILASHTTDGTGTGSFTSNLNGLISSTTYYIRAYATNSIGTSYGEELTFKTTDVYTIPTVSTTAVTGISNSTAVSGGNITGDGGATVTVRGVCWSTTQSPTILGNHTSDGTGTGSFTSNLSGLSSSTTYYTRAYATNIAGTSYGNEISFTTTSNLPTVTTATVTNITTTTATCGGNVVSNGGSTVTARGVCWSTSPSPTMSNSYTSNGSNTGTFVSSLTGLSLYTTFYVRAYATNSFGTSYGNQVSFTSLKWPCGTTITINHVAGSIAPVTKTVNYGTVTNIPGETSKCWITRNLGADHQATAVNDATEASAGWYWQFNRKQGYKNDGSTVTPVWTITSISESSDWLSANDPCTLQLGSGWRLPTSSELNNVDASGNWTTWSGPWNSGLVFHAAGSLNFNNGALNDRGGIGYCWSSGQSGSTNAWTLYFNSFSSYMNNLTKAGGFSVRCLRD